MVNSEFLLTSLVVVLMPGTGVLYTVSTGLLLGSRASFCAAIGCTLGILPHLICATLGLSALLHLSALTFQVVKIAGALYLLYLAWMMWRSSETLTFDKSQGSGATPGQIILRGVLINILNPKLSIFFLAFLPLFISPAGPPPLVQLCLLSSVFMAMTLVVFLAYGLCAGAVRTSVMHSPQCILWLQRSFAAVFAFLGLKLALARQ